MSYCSCHWRLQVEKRVLSGLRRRNQNNKSRIHPCGALWSVSRIGFEHTESALDAAVGGKLVAAYMTTGANDIVIISEAPDGSDLAAVELAIIASGAIASER
jgi:hypothetical protein